MPYDLTLNKPPESTLEALELVNHIVAFSTGRFGIIVEGADTSYF